MKDNGVIRQFETGATRNTANGKNDYVGFNNPLVELHFGNYMNEHRIQSDGTLRASDNWQKGIDRDTYLSSLDRHTKDLWALHKGYFAYKETKDNGEYTHYLINEIIDLPNNWKIITKEDALGGIRFNCDGYWLEEIKKGGIK